MSSRMVLGAIALILLIGCQVQPSPESSSQPTSSPATSQAEVPAASGERFATVTEVEVTAGEPGAYTFVVTVQSPDTGCDQYADWWEVLSEEGELIFRRTLAHSHVNEQPFSRPGGAVEIQPDQLVIVRAHMNPQGYGTQAMQGTVETGFEQVSLPEKFAADLAESELQPQGCEF
ncbi:MAG: hypothetical protein HC879_02970 [Leptolyngbyaceae cyanobacterium SL_5_9]|nr:hypothetical protein [bacterium]NJN56512.1 hypothetical protein [Leptolyngbyaceae cyanobacterium SL_5_9]NJO75625.1 hypothetical protein [Leptolyngbyaceae cyanobacterium RM1_406_9]